MVEYTIRTLILKAKKKQGKLSKEKLTTQEKNLSACSTIFFQKVIIHRCS